MKKTCKQCNTQFEISKEDLDFLNKVSPVFGGKKHQIPPPKSCPECRQQRRLAFRNENKLYKRKCDLCNEEIVSCYNENTPCPVYCNKCWWSDKWDSMEYGQEFDFEKPFFTQFHNLIKSVPRIALSVTHNENSDFVNLSGYNKNSYLLFAAEYNEDCMYGTQVIKCDGCVDTLNCTESKYCYEVVDVGKCYNLYFSKNCRNCNESMFLSDCKGCSNCLFCTNLRNKEYHVFNKEVSKEEYEEKKKEIFNRLNEGEQPKLMEEFLEFDRKAIHKYLEMVNNENSFGNYLFDSKNCKYCFDLSYGEDCKYVYTGFKVKDLVDVCHTTEAELGYHSTSLGYKSYNILFTVASWSCNNGMYFDNCHSSSNIFGCSGLRHKEYCIFNKQYSKEEYEKLSSKIIEHMEKTGEWGDFFPKELSPYRYNETIAYEYFPLTKEEASQSGYKWKDPNPKEYLKAHDDILACSKCSKNYRLTPQELKFYNKNNLPSPDLCPDCRHKKRMGLRNPRKIWDRKCDKCSTDIKTSYSPDTQVKVYCENCYLEEVY